MKTLFTHSTTINFIAPMVFKDKIRYSNIPTNLYNIYLSIFDKPEYDNKIILECSNEKLDSTIYKTDSFIKTMKYNNKSVLHIFSIPTKYEEDLCYIVNGKYSQLSEEYKNKILYFWETDKNSRLYGILYKDKYKRFTENEYLYNKHKIDIADEYYDKPLYIELIYGL